MLTISAERMLGHGIRAAGFHAEFPVAIIHAVPWWEDPDRCSGA